VIHALLAFSYAGAVACGAPVLLTRLTARGIGARLGVAAWLTAMASVLASAAAAIVFLIQAAVAGWPTLAETVCRSVAGGACAPTLYRSALFELALGIAAVVAVLGAVVLAWRYGRSVQQARRRTRAHARAARIAGRVLPGTGPAGAGAAGTGAAGTSTAMVLDSRQPVAYCVPGRPAAIVLSSAAIDVLSPAQLAAVLAHERAHLAGRHHVLTLLTRGLSACFPAVPLFGRGAAEVARLAEMCADDAAARRSGRPVLVTALLAMGTGAAVPVAALGAAAWAVTARVQRLLEPPDTARLAWYALALSTVTAALATGAALVTAL
jgi:Zn-dependent protease with chaperone function